MHRDGPDPRTGSGRFRGRGLHGLMLAATLVFPAVGLGAAPVPLRIEAIAPRIDEVVFASDALGREMKLVVVHPAVDDSPVTYRPVLYLLHGRGRHHRSLIERPETREHLLAAVCWVVLPDGEDGWYLNSPVDPASRYGDYLQEVIRLTTRHYNFSSDPRRRGIAGWSMGGYGAIRWAQTHPQDFNVVAAILGVLDFPREETLPSGQNYPVPVARFGTDRAVWHELNPRNQVAGLRGKSILLITGHEAFDRTMNENFSTALAAADVHHDYRQLSGGHTIAVVQAALPLVLEFAGNKFHSVTNP